MSAPPVPVFVLGIQRSGTTLAANLLAAHPEIAAVVAARHQGVHESVFFSHFARVFGPWQNKEARARAAEAFCRSDYARLAGQCGAECEAAMRAAPSPAAAFRAVMDRLAREQNARAWVEKSPHHTLLADAIAAAMPDARFVCVTRDMADFVRSRLWSYGRVPPPYPRRALVILRAVASAVFHERYLRGFARRVGPGRAIAVCFAALRDAPEHALAPVFESLGLPPAPGLRPGFSPNSSFATPEARRRGLAPADRVLVQLARLLAWSVPQPLLAALQRRRAAKRPAGFPPWVWGHGASGAAIHAKEEVVE